MVEVDDVGDVQDAPDTTAGAYETSLLMGVVGALLAVLGAGAPSRLLAGGLYLGGALMGGLAAFAAVETFLVARRQDASILATLQATAGS